MNRFISKGHHCWRIHVPTPDGEQMVSRSVGCIKIGEYTALEEAIKLRDAIGTSFWGEYWEQVIGAGDILTHLPRTISPRFVKEHDKYGNSRIMCVMNYSARNKDGKYVRKCCKRSVSKYGYQEAYDQCQKVALDAYKDFLPIMRFMKEEGFSRFQSWDI